jgi:hypothetical protein
MVKHQENTQRYDDSASSFSYVLLGGYFTFHLSISLVAWYFNDRLGMLCHKLCIIGHEFHSNSKTVHILFLTSSLVAGVKPVARPLGSCLFLKMAPVRIQACCYLHWGSIQSPNYINSQFHRSGILLFNSKDCSCPESEDFMSILLVGTQTLGLGWMDMDYHITVSCQVQDKIQEF